MRVSFLHASPCDALLIAALFSINPRKRQQGMKKHFEQFGCLRLSNERARGEQWKGREMHAWRRRRNARAQACLLLQVSMPLSGQLWVRSSICIRTPALRSGWLTRRMPIAPVPADTRCDCPAATASYLYPPTLVHRRSECQCPPPLVPLRVRFGICTPIRCSRLDPPAHAERRGDRIDDSECEGAVHTTEQQRLKRHE